MHSIPLRNPRKEVWAELDGNEKWWPTDTIYNDHICENGQWIKFCKLNSRVYIEGSIHKSFVCKNNEWVNWVNPCTKGEVPCGKDFLSCCQDPESGGDHRVSQ